MDAPEHASMAPADAAAESATRTERRERVRKEREAKLSRTLAVWLVAPLSLLLAALILVFFVLYDSSTVSGPSMLPTLRDHDYVLATKGVTDLKRGDIVTLNVVNKGVPEEWVKRVVALPGDSVRVSGDIILINGAAEQFKHIIITHGASTPIKDLIVPAGQIFVAGDNRAVSEDSRYVGTFPASAIRGRVVFIYAPLWRVGPVPAPAR